MKKLSKAQVADFDHHQEQLKGAYEAMEQAVLDYNQAFQEAWGKVQEAQERMNEAITNANTFAEEIAGDIEAYIDDRSEKWQESERAEYYQEWLGKWQEEIEEVEIEALTELELPDEPTWDEESYPPGVGHSLPLGSSVEGELYETIEELVERNLRVDRLMNPQRYGPAEEYLGYDED